jgi:osmotically-inducible protein OsmY
MSITDNEIRKAVSDRLRADRQLAASEIQVDVVDGEVILEGTAETYRTAAIAQEHTTDLPGVKKVVNRVRVEAPDRIAPPTDAALRARIQAALTLMPEVRPTDLVLVVANGIVFIDGFVATLKGKQRIQQMAAGERGVLEVRNNLVVVPARERSDNDIAQDILGALERRALVLKHSITVGVRIGSVTLNGTVPDEAARDFINDIAASVPGVVEIADRLQVDLK